MTQQTIIITGASDGIGAAAARELAQRGERVVLVGRSPEKTEALAAELDAPFYLADFAHLAQVRNLATEIAATFPRFDVLANNAGGIMGEREVTHDGFEKTFQVNYLAPFLLTNLLLPTMAGRTVKVIQTASIAAKYWGNVDLDDLQFERDYAPEQAYGTTKLEDILFTRELDRRYRQSGVMAAAFHPGVVGTNFASDTTHLMKVLYHTPLISKLVTISPEKGADQLVWLAEGTPGETWEPGQYYQKRKVGKTSPQADDADLARELWDRSLAMVNLD